jgi:hypothetical protein
MSDWRSGTGGGGSGGKRGGEGYSNNNNNAPRSVPLRGSFALHQAKQSYYGTTSFSDFSAKDQGAHAGLYRSVSNEIKTREGGWFSMLTSCGSATRSKPRTVCLIILTVLVIFLAIFGPVAFYVIAPAFVRDRIAATNLVFSLIEIRNPSSSGFTIAVEGILSNLVPVGGTLESFDATLGYEGVPVATFRMPAIFARANVDNVVGFSAPVLISSFAAFNSFADALVNSDSIKTTLSGQTSVTATILGTSVTVPNIDFKKEVSVQGARGLKGATVSSFSLAGSNATTAVVDIIVTVPNPSIASILPLGDVATRIFFEGVDMGFAVSKNASLYALVDNNLTLSGVLQSTNVTATQRLISAFLGGEVVSITAIGTSYPSSIPLFLPVIEALSITASLDGSKAEPLISGITVDSMFLEPRGATEVGILLNVTVAVTNLLGANSPINVEYIALRCGLEGEGQVLGTLDVPRTPVLMSKQVHAVSNQASYQHNLLIDPAPLPILNISIGLEATLTLDTTDTKFSQFVLDFVQKSDVSLGLVSNASDAMTVDLTCALGTLTVQIPIASRTIVQGIGGFPSVSLQSFSISGVVDEPVPSILAALNVSLLNPSPAAFTLGSVATLGIYLEGDRVGYSNVYNGTLESGENLLQLVGVIAPPSSSLGKAADLFSSYLSGKNGSVNVRGEDVTLGEGQVTPDWLIGAVQNISLNALLPGLPSDTARALLANTTVAGLDLDFGADGLSQSPAVSGTVLAILRLPFSVPVSVGDTDLELSFVDATTGQVMANVSAFSQKADWFPCNTTSECESLLLSKASISGPYSYSRCIDDIDSSRRRRKSSRNNVQSDPNSVESLQPVGVLKLTLSPPSALQVLNATAFSQLIETVLLSPQVPLKLVGKASPRVTLAIGTLNLTGIAIDQTIILPGMNGFSNPPVIVRQGEIQNTTANSVDLAVNFEIVNKAAISGRLGPVTFTIEYQGSTFITTSIEALTIVQGENFNVALGVFSPPPIDKDPVGNQLARDALSRYLRGLNTQVVVRGGSFSTKNPLLVRAFSAFTTLAVFPGTPTPLIVNATLFLADLKVIERDGKNLTYVPGSLAANNTLAVDQFISAASLTVYLCDDLKLPACTNPNIAVRNTACTNNYYPDGIGFFYDYANLTDTPVYVPAKTVSVSDRYNITLLATADDLAKIALQAVFCGYGAGKLSGNLTTTLQRPLSKGGSEPFTLECFYEQFFVQLYSVLT